MTARTLPTGSITPRGWIAAQARENLEGFLGQLPQISKEVGSKVFSTGQLGQGSEAANVENVQWWNGESEGNWLWGWSAHVRMVGTPEERDEAERRFEEICAHAHDTGYIGMFDRALRTGAILPGECWTQSRVLGALRDWLQAAAGPHPLLPAYERATTEAATRVGQRVAEVFATPETETLVRGHDLQLADLFLDEACGELAAVASDMYEHFSAADLSWIEQDCQLAALQGDEDFRGHGAHAVENLRIPLKLAASGALPAKRAQELREAARRGWTKALRGLGMSGAIRSDETVAAEGEPVRPVPEGGQEYCAVTELALTALAFAIYDGHAPALDVAERMWLNAAQGGRAKDGGGGAYFIADNQVLATHDQGPRWDVSPTHDDAAVCCTPNAGRILPIIVDSMVVASPDGAQLWFYGPSEARVPWTGSEVGIVQRTAYPFEDSIEIDVTGAGAGFTLFLRRPGWCVSLDVDTHLEVTAAPGGVVVHGDWDEKATIRVRLQMELRTERSVDGRASVLYGPLVLSRPIEEEWSTWREYPGAELADRDVVPAGQGVLFAPYLLPSSLEGAQIDRGEVSNSPWRDVPLRVTLPMIDPTPQQGAFSGGAPTPVELVPFGSTTLRYTCLPSLDK